MVEKCYIQRTVRIYLAFDIVKEKKTFRVTIYFTIYIFVIILTTLNILDDTYYSNII